MRIIQQKSPEMRKVTWKRNFWLVIFKKLDTILSHEAVLVYGNSGKCCPIWHRKFLEIMKPGIFGCMESTHCHQSAANLHNLLCNIAFLTCILHNLQIYMYQNLQSDQLPDCLIAQLVEHCNSIPEAMGSNPIQAWFFSNVNFTSTQFWYNYNDQLCCHPFPRSLMMWYLIYSLGRSFTWHNYQWQIQALR